MKRSHVNALITDAQEFCDLMNFRLPPFAFWSPENWARKGHEFDEIRQANHRVGLVVMPQDAQIRPEAFLVTENPLGQHLVRQLVILSRQYGLWLHNLPLRRQPILAGPVAADRPNRPGDAACGATAKARQARGP